MTFRATDKMLESMIGQLNDASKCKYELGHSYGQVHLYKKSMECTGISNISIGNTKKELYYQLRVLLDYLRTEETQVQDYVKNCTHHDVFNIHSIKEGEKTDASNIHEYKGKFECMTCRKEFTEKEYIKSKIPKSREQLRKMRIERK